ncbi:MAG: lytic transglycosylase domain-containing protein, partial [Tsuneonella sp.]
MASALATPASASSSSAEYFRARTTSSNVPQLLSNADSDWYKSLFAALDRKDWAKVDAMFAERPEGPLHQIARAEYYLDAASPKVELPAIQAWFAGGTDLPQAEQMASLGAKRGLQALPALPQEQDFVRQPYTGKRVQPASVNDGTMPAAIKQAILDRIVADDPDGARTLLDKIDAGLSSEARAEWRQRVAWCYYFENRDP